VQIDLGDKPVERLADILREARDAHHVYARHIIDRLSESEESRSE
jgi:hypothetical protein